MLNRTRVILVASLCLVVTMASAQVPCPGFDPAHNINLACQIATTTRASTSGSQTLGQLSPTLASQLSELPTATAVSGTGLIAGSHGLPQVSMDSLGTILTQRGETLGRKQYYVSFNYQRFGFSSIDGVPLKQLDVVNVITTSNGTNYVRGHNRIDLRVDQFVATGSYGLTNRLDVSVFVPFAKVVLKTGSGGDQFNVTPAGITKFTSPDAFFAGSATGIGDVAVNLKANVFRDKQEKGNIAVGGEVRFPTGDATNYLGTGSYGVKPYVVFSRRGRIITPNINLGYQWNSSSILFVNPNTTTRLPLPSSFLYSGGADFRVAKRLTLNAEFLGQMVIDGPRLLPIQQSIPGPGGQSTPFPSVKTLSSTYAMDNLGVGFKVSPFKGWLITGNALIKLDDGGLRSTVVPLVGVSYKF